jgi:solute carrier family 25 folate transporter 32
VVSFVCSHCTSVVDILTFGTDGLARIYHEEGPRGWWKGTSMALFGVTNGALQFMFYEEMKKRAFAFQRARKEGDGAPWDQNKEKLVRRT